MFEQKHAEKLLSSDVNFDRKNILNKSSVVIKKELTDRIESGVSLEDLNDLEKIVPVFKYKTQITIHGVFPDKYGIDALGYKSLVVNKNRSLGVRWGAIDAQKKQKIMEVMRFSDKWSADCRTNVFAITSRRIKTIDEAKEIYVASPKNFIGSKNVYRLPTMYGGGFFVGFYLSGILETEFWKFVSFFTPSISNKKELDAEVEKVEIEASKRSADREKKAEEARIINNYKYYKALKELDLDNTYKKLEKLPKKFDELSLFLPRRGSEGKVVQVNILLWKKGSKILGCFNRRDVGDFEKPSKSKKKNRLRQQFIEALIEGTTESVYIVESKSSEAPASGIIQRNEKLNGVELHFGKKPSDEVLSKINSLNFRYHRKKKLWFRKYDEDIMVELNLFLGGSK